MTLEDALVIGEGDGLTDAEGIREAMIVLRVELARMHSKLSFFESEIERQEAYLSGPRTGMGGSLPSMSDFAGVPPSALSRMRWHLRNIRGT